MWQALDTRQHVLAEASHTPLLGVFRLGQRDLCHHYVCRIVSEAGAHGNEEALDQQGRRYEHHHGQRNLRRHENPPQPGAPFAARRLPRRFLEHAIHVESRILERRSQTEDQAAQQRDSQRESQSGEVQIDVPVVHQVPANVTGNLGLDPPHPPKAEQHAGHAAKEKQQKRFRQKLPRQPAPRRAKRSANRKLLRAACRAGQHQVRHIRAGDQQNQPYNRETDHYLRRPFVPANLLGHGANQQSQVRVRLRELAF